MTEMGDFDLNREDKKQRRKVDSWRSLDSHKHGRSKRYCHLSSLSLIFDYTESIC